MVVNADKIKLSTAMKTSVWKMVAVGEPNREVAVLMTYGELMNICDLLEIEKEVRNYKKD